MAAVFETNDAGYIVHAFNVSVRAKKMNFAASGVKLIGALIEQMLAEGEELTQKTALTLANQIGIKLTVTLRRWTTECSLLVLSQITEVF